MKADGTEKGNLKTEMGEPAFTDRPGGPWAGMFAGTVEVGPYRVGQGPPLIVAEIGGNHGGDVDLARRMIEAAARAGAHAVKFQAYRAGTFLRRDSAYYRELAAEELPPEVFFDLKRQADDRGVLFLASIFDHHDREFYARLDPPLIKIASGEVTNLPLLETAASLGKPVVLSTGAADLGEIDRALDFLAAHGVREVILTQCTSMYPCPDDQVNLAVIPELRRRYGLPVGFSDHSLGPDIALAAAALGACLIEKHFTLDRSLPGGDNDMSILPAELAAIEKGTSRIYNALGSAEKKPQPGEGPTRAAIRRSVVAARALPPGTVLRPPDLGLKRPGDGLPPEDFYRLIGKTTTRDLAEDEPLSWDKVR